MPAIDALRGVAILLVLVYHAGANAWRLPPWRADGWLSVEALRALGAKWLLVPPLHFGFVGVHCFFVLSGFCIHLRAAHARADGRPPLPSLRAFFLRRFWRIYPPYWIALALFGLGVPLAARLAGHAAEPAAPSDLALHATMLHTLRDRTIFSINPAFWSLATEEQFYLAYPLVLPLLARFGVRRVLAASLALSLAWRAAALAVLPPTVDHFLEWRVLVHALFLPRWYEWLLGCALAEAAAAPRNPLDGRARPLALAGALLLVAGMATRAHVALDKLLADALFSTGFACLTGAALVARPSANRARAAVAGALAAVGRRAYGLYLVHQPILDWERISVVVRAVAAPLAGWLFSSVAERPFERRSQRVGASLSPAARDEILAPCEPSSAPPSRSSRSG